MYVCSTGRKPLLKLPYKYNLSFSYYIKMKKVTFIFKSDPTITKGSFEV